MNKEIELRKNTIFLFILNVVYLLILVSLRSIFIKLEYNNTLVNISFISYIIILIIGIIFNILFLMKPLDEKKSILACLLIFFFVVVLSVFIPIIVNKSYEKKFSKIGIMLSNYCKTFKCDTYETLYKNDKKEFIIRKKYLDYNEKENDIKISVLYNMKKVTNINLIIYSDNELFSSELIKKQLDGYIKNFNLELNEEMINKAFRNRFEGSIKDGDASYEVMEIYNNNELVKLKTTIKFNLIK